MSIGLFQSRSASARFCFKHRLWLIVSTQIERNHNWLLSFELNLANNYQENLNERKPTEKQNCRG